MINNFRDAWLQDFFINDIHHKKIPASIRNQLFKKIQMLDDATSDLDLRSPPSNHFEKLSGRLKDRYSIRVNKQWRLIFFWNNAGGEADNVYLDSHDYKG